MKYSNVNRETNYSAVLAFLTTLFVVSVFLFAGNPAEAQTTQSKSSGDETESSSMSTRSNVRRRVMNYNRDNVSFELLGRAGAYSLNYDRMLGRQVSIGVGFSYLSLDIGIGNAATAAVSFMAFPVYGNFYLKPSLRHRLYLTGGVTMLNVGVKVNSPMASQAAQSAQQFAENSEKTEIQQFPIGIDLSTSATTVVPLPQAGGGYEFRSSGGILTRVSGYMMYVGTIIPWAGFSLGAHF